MISFQASKLFAEADSKRIAAEKRAKELEYKFHGFEKSKADILRGARISSKRCTELADEVDEYFISLKFIFKKFVKLCFV